MYPNPMYCTVPSSSASSYLHKSSAQHCVAAARSVAHELGGQQHPAQAKSQEKAGPEPTQVFARTCGIAVLKQADAASQEHPGSSSQQEHVRPHTLTHSYRAATMPRHNKRLTTHTRTPHRHSNTMGTPLHAVRNTVRNTHSAQLRACIPTSLLMPAGCIVSALISPTNPHSTTC